MRKIFIVFSSFILLILIPPASVATEAALPELINLLPSTTTAASAGDSFSFHVSVDTHGKFLARILLSLQRVSLESNNFVTDGTQISCYSAGVDFNRPVSGIIDTTLYCDTNRNVTAGFYNIYQLLISTTTCEVAANNLGLAENMKCQYSPYRVDSGYGFAYSDGHGINMLFGVMNYFPNISMGAAPTLKRPQVLDSSISESSIKISYPQQRQVECKFSSDIGIAVLEILPGSGVNSTITWTANVYSVRVMMLQPNQKVVISGKCTAVDDQAVVDFEDTLTTALPPPPTLSKVSQVTSTPNTVTIDIVRNKADGVKRSFTSTSGSLSYDEGKSQIVIINLLPITKVDIAEISVDAFEQTVEGHLTSATTNPAPKITTKSQGMRTITCSNGKLTKKIVATKPVCPKGYKKK